MRFLPHLNLTKNIYLRLVIYFINMTFDLVNNFRELKILYFVHDLDSIFSI